MTAKIYIVMNGSEPFSTDFGDFDLQTTVEDHFNEKAQPFVCGDDREHLEKAAKQVAKLLAAQNYQCDLWVTEFGVRMVDGKPAQTYADESLGRCLAKLAAAVTDEERDAFNQWYLTLYLAGDHVRDLIRVHASAGGELFTFAQADQLMSTICKVGQLEAPVPSAQA